MKQHIKIYFDKKKVMHICPRDSIGAMALEHFYSLVQINGLKMFDLHTDIPPEPQKEPGTEIIAL